MKPLDTKIYSRDHSPGHSVGGLKGIDMSKGQWLLELLINGNMDIGQASVAAKSSSISSEDLDDMICDLKRVAVELEKDE